MKRRFILSLCLSVGLALSACGSVESGDEGDLSTAGMALNVDLIGGTDVAGFRITATQVDCQSGDPLNTAPFSADESLQEVNLPGDNSTFTGNPYDEDSSHHFSDHYFVVPPGCYDLQATPIDAAGDASKDCATATLYNQVVHDHAHNEYHLLSQCRGEARTALDVLSSVNHPPELDLSVDKFMCAGAGVVACATASDPDGDPVRFEWEALDPGCGGPTPQGHGHGGHGSCYTPEVISWDYDSASDETTECVVIPSDRAETRRYQVTVRDLGWDGQSLVPLEDLLPEQSGVSFDASKSQASLLFNTHALADCTPGGMAFIGVTLGANLHTSHGKLKTDPSFGMSKSQANQLATNAVNYVNPNLLGDSDPRILIVHDKGNVEDKLDGKYIQQRLKASGFSSVDYMEEPSSGLQKTDLVSYSVVWFVNPGYPLSRDASFKALRDFRADGGGLVVSGDDANQNDALSSPYSMSTFSFMEFDTSATNDNPNGTRACGHLTDDNQGKRYRVVLDASAPLAAGMSDLSFYYGNDIDRNIAMNLGETVNATTKGLKGPGLANCLGAAVPVMTTVPAGTTLAP